MEITKTTIIANLSVEERYEDLKAILDVGPDFEIPTPATWPPRPEDWGEKEGAVRWLLENAPIALLTKD